MLNNTNKLLTNIDLVENIFFEFKNVIKGNLLPYKNHVYRVINFYMLLQNNITEEEKKKIIVSACFHDIGIWSNHTFDYLQPSIILSQEYLKNNNLVSWEDDIEKIIDNHHKLTPFKTNILVEKFRKADLIDVSLGIISFGINRKVIKEIKVQFPNIGFHRSLVTLTVNELLKHPLKPLPVLKW